MGAFISLPSEPCPLCFFAQCEAIDLNRGYAHCPRCDLRFLHSSLHLNRTAEESRYRLHENDSTSPAYQAFVKPLFMALAPLLPPAARGLDFGCGEDSALAKIFTDNGFSMALFDPIFAPDQACWNEKYDFIVLSEVAEHLFTPGKEFARLVEFLKPGGWLGVMTLLFTETTDFTNWYYRRDPTHVAFYSHATFKWLADSLGFTQLTYAGERIALLRQPDYAK